MGEGGRGVVTVDGAKTRERERIGENLAAAHMMYPHTNYGHLKYLPYLPFTQNRGRRKLEQRKRALAVVVLPSLRSGARLPQSGMILGKWGSKVLLMDAPAAATAAGMGFPGGQSRGIPATLFRHRLGRKGGVARATAVASTVRECVYVHTRNWTGLDWTGPGSAFWPI